MSTSFGPNAAILLHMVAISGYSIPIIHIDPGDVPEENKRYGATLLAHLGIAVQEIRTTDKIKAMDDILDTRNAQAVLHGVRADQSDYRTSLTCATLRQDNRLRIYPIFRMTSLDVEVYLKKYGLPLHTSGIPGKKENAECGLHI